MLWNGLSPVGFSCRVSEAFPSSGQMLEIKRATEGPLEAAASDPPKASAASALCLSTLS